MRIINIFCFITILFFQLSGQISITGTPYTYTQDFNSLASTGTGNAWTNNSTLSGWYLFVSTGAAAPTYDAGTGTSTTGTFLSYGTAADDRALGGLGSGGAYFGSPATGAVAGWIAVAFTNNTGNTISNTTISFDGEQWRNGGNTSTQDMVLQYGFGSSFATVSSWTTPGGNFNWTSPIATSTAAAVVGNVAGLVSGRGGALNNLNWTNGSTLWIRWIELNDAGIDHGLAIDNFTLSNIVLPVTFNNFDVSKENKKSDISFSSASETNNDYFSIERSEEGRNFSSIGTLKGAGNSSREIRYEYTDEKPLPGINYYRIKQTDFDGKYSYSEIKSVKFGNVLSFDITPRQTEGRLMVATEIENYSLQVLGSDGRLLLSLPNLSASQNIDLDAFKPGIYYIRLIHDGVSETKRIVRI
jgi:hypothetical protein